MLIHIKCFDKIVTYIYDLKNYLWVLFRFTKEVYTVKENVSSVVLNITRGLLENDVRIGPINGQV